MFSKEMIFAIPEKDGEAEKPLIIYDGGQNFTRRFFVLSRFKPSAISMTV
jgi:hypothetical protein